MATTTTRILRFSCLDALEQPFTISIRHCKDPDGSGEAQLTDAQVQAAAAAIVANGGNIWAKTPTSVESAEVITTEKTDMALS